MPDESTIWVEDEGKRREYYKQILTGGDRTDLIKLIKTLYAHEKIQKDVGKRLHATDERFLKDAEKILYEEFAHVLNLTLDQVVPFITQQIEASQQEQ
jgi:CarD family transcriptional regulator